MAIILKPGVYCNALPEDVEIYRYGSLLVTSCNDSVILKFTPSTPEILSRNGSCVIELEDCNVETYRGYMIPYFSAAVLLPPIYYKIECKILNLRARTLVGEYTIERIPILNGQHMLQEKVPLIMPSNHVTIGRVMQMRVYKILRISLFPVVYSEATRKLTILNEITLQIRFIGAKSKVFPRHLYSKAFERIVEKTCVNKNMLRTYIFSSSDINTKSSEVKYVIITSNTLASTVERLKDHKIEKGLTAQIYTLDYIYHNYHGRDSQEKIRNFLKYCYNNLGTEWVLLVGDWDVVPIRKVYNPEPYPYFGDIPTDYYYADLTGNWDSDNDRVYGEFEDNVDWAADVFVGRLPVHSPDELNILIDKIVTYENTVPRSDEYWTRRMLFASTILCYKNEYRNFPKTDGATVSEYIIDKCLPKEYTYIRLYEKEGLSPSQYPCEDALTYESLEHYFSQGFAWVSVISHGWYNSTYRKIWAWDDGDCTPSHEKGEISYISFLDTRFQVTNYGHFSIAFVATCLTACVDYSDDCLGEYLTKLSYRGAIAYVGATRSCCYVPGWESLGDGCIQDLMCLFWKAMFERHIEIRKPGECLYEALFQYYLYHGAGNYCDRIDLFSFILLGDPELHLCDDDEEPPSLSNAGSDVNFYDNINDDYRLWVTVEDPSGVYNVWFKYKFENGMWSDWQPYSYKVGDAYYFCIPRFIWESHVGEKIYWQVKAMDNDCDHEDDRATIISQVYIAEGVQDDDSQPPEIFDITVLDENNDSMIDSTEKIRIKVEAEDNSGISEVILFYDWDGELYSSCYTLHLEQVDSKTFMTEELGPFPSFSDLVFKIVVYDNDNDRENDRLSTESQIMRFKVYAVLLVNVYDGDGESISDALVVLERNGNAYSSAYTDASGMFKAFISSAGDYDVKVFYLGILVGRTQVSIPEVSSISIKAAVYDWCLNVVDANGESIPGMKVVIKLLNGSHFISLTTDETGRLYLENIPSTQYIIEVHWMRAILVCDAIMLTREDQADTIWCPLFKLTVHVKDFFGVDIDDATVSVSFPNGSLVILKTTLGGMASTLLAKGAYIVTIRYGRFEKQIVLAIDRPKRLTVVLPQILSVKIGNTLLQLSPTELLLIIEILIINITFIPIIWKGAKPKSPPQYHWAVSSD